MTKVSPKIMPPWKVMTILIGIPFVITTTIVGLNYISNQKEINKVQKQADEAIKKEKQRTEQLRLQQQWLREKPKSV